MTRSSRFVTVALAVATVAFVGVAVIAGLEWADARDRFVGAEDREAVAGDDGSLALDLAAAQDAAQGATDDAERLRALLVPDVVTAVVRVQTSAVDSACVAARTATRDGSARPTGESVLAFAVVATTDPALDAVPARWSEMLAPALVQAEVDRCVADETAVIEAERQAAAAQAAAAADSRAAASAPCRPDQLTITNSPTRGTYCVDD